ncbi:MAG TPA: adenylate/guanylate cyclase domain-containing protein, partial [Anaerolineales bacterium]|nr:adenylate/guanylate cyclase domain-containing protein [Anaerolineales bacterium]
MSLHPYLPQDRLRALARGEPLPHRTSGSALFADISGFTPLTESLTQTLGPRRGIEALTHQINAVYESLIAEIEQYGGSVIGFAGDAITCWFDGADDASLRAVTAAFALQMAMEQFPTLGLKIAVTTGPAQRFALGNPEDQYWDTLLGRPISRLAMAEHFANRGEIVADEATFQAVSTHVQVGVWHNDGLERFAVLHDLTHPAPPAPA